MAQKYFARRPMGYTGRDLDHGQLTELSGAPNDEKLLRLGYLQQIEEGASISQCGYCQAEFVSQRALKGHGDLRHSSRSLTPMEEDAAMDAQERMLEQVAPLYLDQTAASRASSHGALTVQAAPAKRGRPRAAALA